jgi:hypothetical protein
MRRFSHDLVAEIPGYGASTRRLRSAESLAVGRALMMAAVVCICRAAIVPWYMYYSDPASRHEPTDLEIVTTSILMMVVFTMCSMWTRFAPMGAVLISLTCFGAVVLRDAFAYSDVWSQGRISKTLIGILLLRALMNAILGRTM